MLDVAKADVNSSDDNHKTALHMVAKSQYDTIAKILCKHGAFLNAKDSKGVTPLRYASSFGAVSIVSVSITLKSDANLADNTGNAPLHYASWHGHEEIVRIPDEDVHTGINVQNADG